MSLEIQDQFKEGISTCCGASVYEDNRCVKCKENCGVEDEKEFGRNLENFSEGESLNDILRTDMMN